MVSADALVTQLRRLGVEQGGVLLVHAAFSKVAPVVGGPAGLLAALRETVGRDGTLVMPSMADEGEEPFDAGATPCRAMGVVADTFWRLPGVLRSDSPHAFAAAGPHAAAIVAPHPVEVPHGPDSPVGRVLERDGHVLLLGVGHSENTTIHLAESLAGVRYRRRASATILVRGRPRRVDYEEIDHCCQRFALVDAWLDERGAQRHGVVGRAPARLARSADVVDLAVARLRREETVFLHPAGVDAECDEARASLARRTAPHSLSSRPTREERMATTKRLETFRSIPLFAGLSDAALKRIMKVATEFDAPAGQVLIQPGREGSGMFVLEEGTVLVESGGKRIRLGPGEFFGELALLTSEATRAARVRADSDVRCLAISRADFAKLLRSEPGIAISMLEVLARRLSGAMHA